MMHTLNCVELATFKAMVSVESDRVKIDVRREMHECLIKKKKVTGADKLLKRGC